MLFSSGVSERWASLNCEGTHSSALAKDAKMVPPHLANGTLRASAPAPGQRMPRLDLPPELLITDGEANNMAIRPRADPSRNLAS